MYFVEFDKVLKFAAFPLRLNLILHELCITADKLWGISYLSAIRNPNIKFDVITQCLPISATLVLLEEMLLDYYYHMYKHVTASLTVVLQIQENGLRFYKSIMDMLLGYQKNCEICFVAFINQNKVLNPLDVFVHVAVTGIIKIVTMEKRT
uniref:Uncharacterized protein n=1 Tax=Glossina palpalis gambiensis TaxID=67801 RepID=A0A1B0BEU6_9MUSC